MEGSLTDALVIRLAAARGHVRGGSDGERGVPEVRLSEPAEYVVDCALSKLYTSISTGKESFANYGCMEDMLTSIRPRR